MFKKTQRFSFKKGVPRKKIITPLFFVRFQVSNSPTYAVVAGKSVSKKSVQRNRIKRLTREILKEILKSTSNKFDLVIFLRQPFVEYKKSVIIQELQNIIHKINS